MRRLYKNFIAQTWYIYVVKIIFAITARKGESRVEK